MGTINLTLDLDVLFGTIDGEGESEPLVGKCAIAASVMNRVALAKVHVQFGNGTVRSACLFPAQYDCWEKGPDNSRIMAIDLDKLSPAQQISMFVAEMALAGLLKDPTDGSTYYYDPREVAKPPPWSKPPAILCGQYGSQLFYKNVS